MIQNAWSIDEDLAKYDETRDLGRGIDALLDRIMPPEPSRTPTISRIRFNGFSKLKSHLINIAPPVASAVLVDVAAFQFGTVSGLITTAISILFLEWRLKE